MTVSLKGLEAWFHDRSKWLQDAARRLIQNETLTEQDYTELLTLCIQEAAGQAVTFTGIPADGLSLIETTTPLHLESISDVHGINALAPSKPLLFGKSSLCIVYGRNGAGKSGYVRLLKHACGARRPGELIGNIFNSDIQPKMAKLTYIEDTQAKTSLWNGTPIIELQGVEIYDTVCGLVYVNDENEVAFEPWLLRLFTQLTVASTTLSQRIKKQVEGLVSKKPIFPPDFATTSSAAWYNKLSAGVSRQEIDEKTAWEVEHEAGLTDINKRLAEQTSTAKAAALRRQKELSIELVTELKKYFENLSDEHCNAYLQKKADTATKRKTADEDAKKVFERAPLAGIGSETWRSLWNAARLYSEEHAYRAKPFPNTEEDACCILCQQELDIESRGRFISFETFVKGELQKLALEAEQNLQKLADAFAEVPAREMFTVKMEATGIADETIRATVLDFTSLLAKRRQACLAADSMAEIPTLPTKWILIQLVRIVRNIAKQARSYDKDAKGQNRPELEQKRKELSARKWLSQQHKAIEDEIARLKTVSLLGEAERLTNTKALSQRKSILTDELITKAYQERFQNELKHLGTSNLSVDVDKSRAEVGRVYHRISLKNVNKSVKTSDILSEGEFRIVSLAAFLADTEGRGAKTPFIFDDPISSLDHVYEEATAKRLVKLSAARQVIVFTHRLSLVSFLEKYSAKHGIKHELVCLSRYIPGEITDLPIDLKRTDKAVNTLLNERLAAAKKAFAQGDTAYENEAKGLCRGIRILIERIVEMDLLNEVIRRFSQEINTKGKVHALAKITEDDCNFIDEYMTKYSRYEHSQSDETPLSLPKPEEIETDLKAIAGFIETIKERKKA